MGHITELPSATSEQVSPTTTLVRFRTAVRLTAEVFAEVMQHRRTSTQGPQAVIVFLPEHTDYDSRVMLVDHYAVNELADRTSALAIVCDEQSLDHLLRLYFAYHPSSFEVKFCSDIKEASAWITAQEVTPVA